MTPGTLKPPVLDSEVSRATEELKSYYTPPGIDQIPAEMIQEGNEILRFEIDKTY
jgi:hypothetical protein